MDFNEKSKKLEHTRVDVENSDVNFFYDSLKFSPDEKDRHSPLGLCCCEYIDRNNEKFHLLGCCCNCEDFDIVFTK